MNAFDVEKKWRNLRSAPRLNVFSLPDAERVPNHFPRYETFAVAGLGGKKRRGAPKKVKRNAVTICERGGMYRFFFRTLRNSKLEGKRLMSSGPF
jgi:hypothetical protein